MTGEVMEELGYGFSAWNGKDASLSIHIGTHCPEVGNNVVLSSAQSFTGQVWQGLAEAAIRAFDPDALVVTSHAFLEAHGNSLPWQAGGWFTYQKGGRLQEHIFPTWEGT